MTAHAAVTLVLDATEGAAAVLGELEAVLRGALGPADRLVVVDPAPHPAASDAAVSAPTRLAPIDEGSRVQRRLSAPGLLSTVVAERPSDVVVVVDSSVRIPNRAAVTELVAVLMDSGASAAVPASNGGSHPQCPPDPLEPGASRTEVRAEARRCLERFRGSHHPISSFGDGMIAVPPGALTRDRGPGCGAPDRTGSRVPAVVTAHGRPSGGLIAEVRDMLSQADPNVVVAAGAYVHSLAPAPLISVCLIVKDEAEDLPACLASVASLADEVVIYDTGSTDDTVTVARQLGATVIEGEWRNDFGWARNQAMAAARGTWILSIDADERLELHDRVPDQVRALLNGDPPVDRFIVDLFDLQGSVHAPVRASTAVPMARLFRRRHCRWVGGLHEQPDNRPGLGAARSLHLPGVRLLHRGYLTEIVAAKGKWQRNLRVATAGLVDVPDDDKGCFDLARSLRSVGEHGRALALFERAADLRQNPVITRGALEFVILTLTETDLPELTGPYLARLEAMAGGTETARYLRGWVAIRQRHWDRALSCFEGIGDYHDHFTGFRAESVPLGLALAYRGLGRPADAAARAVAALQRNPLALDAWAVLFDTTPAGGTAEAELVAAFSAQHLVALVAALSRFDAEHRDRLCEARWASHPGEAVVLAAAAQVAPDLPTDSALRWSARLRASHLTELCPFRAVARNGSRTAAERAGVVADAIERLELVDVAAPDLVEALKGLVGQLLDQELGTLLDASLANSPAAAGSVIVAGASTVARCVVMMESLVRAGFDAQALAVLSHAADADPDRTRLALQARPGLMEQLRETARTDGRPDLAAVLAHAA